MLLDTKTETRWGEVMAKTALEPSGLCLCFLLPALVVIIDPAMGNSSSDTDEEEERPPLGRFLLDTDNLKEVSVVSQGENSTSMLSAILLFVLKLPKYNAS